MKRRTFGFAVGSNLAMVASGRAADAQPAVRDPKLLDTSLTPMGGERAGNADGSIPAWTGGLKALPLPPDQPVDVPLFAEEEPLLTVDAGNMAQHTALLTPGTQAMIRKFGFSVLQYQTHRTAAAPQYVYDNTAQNAASAQLTFAAENSDHAAGVNIGFTGAYGGVPFPIIDTSDPLTGGVQLIWNHLTTWQGYAGFTKFAPVFTVTSGKLELASAGLARFQYPFYDPNGSVASHESGLDFDGYYSRTHSFFQLPVSLAVNELIIWHSTNLGVHPDIVWTLLSGQGRVRKAPNLTYGTPNPATNGFANMDETSCFSGSPAQYDWHYIGRQEMLVPYNCNAMHFHTAGDLLGANYPHPDIVRWEKHRVWVVEAVLRPGIQNMLTRRRFYIDEDSWCALLGEAYDDSGTLIKYYTAYNRCVPSIPAMRNQGWLVCDLRSGNYVYAGSVNYGSSVADEFILSQNESYFEPEQMAAICAF